MFNEIQLKGLCLIFIFYLILIMPSIIICFNKKYFIDRKKFNNILIGNIIYNIILSMCFYLFYEKIFNIFNLDQGIINYAIYSGKIIFMASSLFAVKYLIPGYIYHTKNKKISIIFAIAKIIDTLICMIIGYYLFSQKGILFAIPVADIIYYIAYTYCYLKVFR